jgi:general secretion pathway protein E
LSLAGRQQSNSGSLRLTGTSPGSLAFASHLLRKHALTGDLMSKIDTSDKTPQPVKLRDLWELTELSAGEFADEVAQFYQLRRQDLPRLLSANSLASKFSPRFLREMSMFPCKSNDGSGNKLVVADPTDAAAVRAAEIILGRPIAIEVASFEDIATVLSKRLGEDETVAQAAEVVAAPQTDEDIESLRDLASGAPVVRAVDDLLEKAVELRATDIHIEPVRGSLLIRLRIDGLLRNIPIPSNVLPQALISRIKILAGLNIAERRLPQDGAAHLRTARSAIDIRVATMPTQYGESAAIRLLPKDRGLLDVAKLGLSDHDESKLHRLLKLPHGIVFVTGPTGSGKTTTLATMLSLLNDSTRKILTIEDPIEYEMRGVNQSQVKPEIGLTFAAALRAFVRQDPDVIMVGEVRDSETADTAIHASLTGHLVLTTLHTETAAAAVPRLLDLGVEPFLLQSTLRAVIAQRLVRILCDRCKIEHPCTSATLKNADYAILGLRPGESVYEPAGCEHCSGTGFRGRTGLFEVLEISDEIRELMGSRRDSGAITRATRDSGMISMFEHGIAKWRAGITSASEVLRVSTIR